MKMMLNLIVLLSAAALTLAAPATEKELPVKTTSTVEDLPKDKIDDKKDSTSIVEDSLLKTWNPDDSPEIKEILDKIDKSDLAAVMEEEMALKSAVDGMIISEVKKIVEPSQETPVVISEVKKIVEPSQETPMMISEVKKTVEPTQETPVMISEVKKIVEPTQETPVKSEAQDSDGKLATTMLKKSDSTDYIKKITEETDKQMKDVASAVAEIVTSLPVPAKPDTSNKYTEVIGHFVSELLQIPMLLLHAVSNAIATLTNNKVNIPTPALPSLPIQSSTPYSR